MNTRSSRSAKEPPGKPQADPIVLPPGSGAGAVSSAAADGDGGLPDGDRRQPPGDAADEEYEPLGPRR